MSVPSLLKVRGLLSAYAAKRLTPTEVVASALARIADIDRPEVWILRVPAADLEARARALIEDMTGLVPAPHLGTSSLSLGWHGQTLLLRPDLAAQARLRRLPLPGIEPRGALALMLPEVTVVATDRRFGF